MALVVKQFVKPPLRNNNYLVADKATGNAFLVDCSCPDEEIMTWAQQNAFNVKYILLTHGHFDHLMGVNYYKKRYGLTAYLYKKDAALLSRFKEYLAMMRLPEAELPVVRLFSLDQQFQIGAHTVEIIPTPGHTQGGVCYVIDGHLFSGDTLFQGTCGRTDLPESDEQAMQESLKKIFEKFSDETPVYPGHGALTTIGYERELY